MSAGSISVVSVIIPAFGHERYIGETLASVFRQSFCDYEIVAVNRSSRTIERGQVASTLIQAQHSDTRREIIGHLWRSVRYHPAFTVAFRIWTLLLRN